MSDAAVRAAVMGFDPLDAEAAKRELRRRRRARKT